MAMVARTRACLSVEDLYTPFNIHLQIPLSGPQPRQNRIPRISSVHAGGRG